MKYQWKSLGSGSYIEESRRYTIHEDKGIWVLCGLGSLVRCFSTLYQAKRSAEESVLGVSVAADAATISSGHIVHGTYGWVILHRPQHGAWREVTGPFRSRSAARQFLRRCVAVQ